MKEKSENNDRGLRTLWLLHSVHLGIFFPQKNYIYNSFWSVLSVVISILWYSEAHYYLPNESSPTVLWSSQPGFKAREWATWKAAFLLCYLKLNTTHRWHSWNAPPYIFFGSRQGLMINTLQHFKTLIEPLRKMLIGADCFRSKANFWKEFRGCYQKEGWGNLRTVCDFFQIHEIKSQITLFKPFEIVVHSL